MIISNGVQVKCKRCGKPAMSDEFTLDPVYRMMVCRACVKERMSKPNKQASTLQKQKEQPQQESQKRPAGWDGDDDSLERISRYKSKTKTDYKRIDADRIKYTCSKCKFQFIHNTTKRYPNACPNCGTPITGLR